MKLPSVMEGVGVALLASMAGAAVFAVLSVMLDTLGVFRLVVAGLALAYVLYLLLRNSERLGRLSVLALWFVIAGANLLLVTSPLLYVVIHLALIWLIRALYYYTGVLPALLDLGLMAVSLAVAIWAGETTHSLLLSLWCFFLVQALFVLLPTSFTQRSKHNAALTDDAFDRAHRAAEVALRKLTTLY